MKILICGGCGFIGSNLAVHFAGKGEHVVCLDNLSRRGSEILLKRVTDAGCGVVHGDLRNPEDLAKAGHFDLMIECSAEPSVMVGSQGADARFMVRNNLESALNAFERVRELKAGIIFLSTSRVYPYDVLNNIQLDEQQTRFDLVGSAREVSAGNEATEASVMVGLSLNGIAETFQLDGIRSLYGATKLAAEIILKEYAVSYDMPAIINRFGVVAGPWQLGKVDQGVFTHWLASHYFKKPLKYIGYGGEGKQVRDLLHIEDLIRLVELQIDRIAEFRAQVFNAGGGRVANLSLQETTQVCQELTGHILSITPDMPNRPADLPWYITDNTKVFKTFNWLPRKSGKDILTDTYSWLKEHEQMFSSVLNAGK